MARFAKSTILLMSFFEKRLSKEQGIEPEKITCGHTHIQFVCEIYDKQIINAGSAHIKKTLQNTS